MTTRQFFDRLLIEDAPRRTRDGYLVTEVRAGRTGIQKYLGSEVGLPDRDIVRVYRPAEEVFNGDAMASFTSLPVTVDHPPELVNSKNWKNYAVGFTGETCHKDGGYVRVPLALKDEAAIDSVIRGGKRELSFGYTCDLDMTAGKTEDGQEYDAIQRNVRGNHLAIVSAGRAGRECRFGDTADDQSGGSSMSEVLKNITVDGFQVSTTDAGAAAIATLQGKLAGLTTDNLKLITDHKSVLDSKDAEIKRLTDAVAAKDAELGKKDGEIEALKKTVTDTAAIDKLVAERADVLGRARTIAADVDFSAKSVADIRRLAVAKKLGDEKVKDKADAYVEALFDTLAAAPAGNTSSGTTRDPIADAFRQTPAQQATTDNLHAEMVKSLEEGWKKPLGATH